MTFTGEMLASDSTDSKIDLDMVGATFNDIFRSAHEASKKIGLEACNETVIKTPNGLILMGCSGVHSKVHFHSIVVMDKDGNQALAKMALEKMMPKVMDDLA
jgi:predicted regulator of Ras-like GTPase activity (Roadblock/LC7/MglB family)